MSAHSGLVVVSVTDLADMIEAAVARAMVAHAKRPTELPAGEHLTVTEAATHLRCSPRTVRRRIALGKLVATASAGGSERVLVSRASVLQYVELGTR